MRRRWLGALIEMLVSFGAASLLALLCTTIKINPLDRVGQVSGLAAIQIRFLFLAVPVLVGLGVVAKLRPGWFPLAGRVACAALAGLASGFVAGGVIVALRGTPFCLNAGAGDSDIIVMWATALQKGGDATLMPPAFYPPMFPHLLRYYMDATGLPGVYALKDLQIVFTVIAGPCAYLAWRLVLRPGWALGIGVVASLVIIDPYKPYGNLVLVLLVPIAIRYFARLRDSGDKHPYELVRTGVVYGVGLAALCLLYSGWFRWAAPGLVIVGLVVFPWRQWKRGGILTGVTVVVIGIVGWNYFTGVADYQQKMSAATAVDKVERHMIVDDYIYFDAVTEPTYFSMWKGDLPGTTEQSEWPPPGELGGLGLFSLVCFAGTGIAVALGKRRTDVLTMLALVGTIWFQRMWTAHYMYQTKLVQLWPRTTLAIVYLFVLFAGYGVYLVYRRFAERATETSPLRAPNATIGALVALTLVFGSMGSSIADRYMPYDSLPRTTGWLAFLAHDAWKKVKAAPETAPK